jgi:hypothetical protein
VGGHRRVPDQLVAVSQGSFRRRGAITPGRGMDTCRYFSTALQAWRYLTSDGSKFQ